LLELNPRPAQNSAADLNAAADAAAQETQAEKSALADEVKQIIEQQKSFKVKAFAPRKRAFNLLDKKQSCLTS